MTNPLLTVRVLRTPGRRGDRVPLVLLHGFPLDGRMWADVAALLPDDREVLAVDLPGSGTSPSGEEVEAALRGTGNDLPPGPALEVSAEAVVQSLAALGVARAVVAGLSMGGYVAMAVLDRHPTLVAGLALLDTKPAADGEAAAANRRRIAAAVRADRSLEAVHPMARALLGESSLAASPHLVGQLGDWIDGQTPQGVAWSQLAMAARPDRSEVLRGYSGPALVLVGDEDSLSPVDVAREMHVALSDSTFVVVPRAGHMTAVENAPAVAAAFTELLARVDR